MACLQAQTKSLTLDDVWASRKFSPMPLVGVNSMNNGKHYSSQTADNQGKTCIVKYDFASGNAIDTILKNVDLVNEKGEIVAFDDYKFNGDESKILFSADTEPIYRRSSKENYYLYDRNTKKTIFLSKNGKQSLATLSPNGKQVAFVRQNNIFVMDLNALEERQITSDGKRNQIINGSTDWVYEEEFEFAKAFYWSPDGSKILYYRFDESQVKEFVMPIYNGLYPENYTYKYPKAGEDNSKVTLFVKNLETDKTTQINTGTQEDQYIARAGWTKDGNTLWFQRLNRLQNHLELCFANAQTGESKIIVEEKSPTWVDVNNNLTFLGNGKQFVWTNETKTGFNHSYLYDISGKLLNPITQGNWEISEFYGIDEQKKILYYSSTEQSTTERHLYRVQLDGKNKTKLSSKKGNNEVLFSTDFSHYINTHSSANSPYVVSIHAANGKELRLVQDNKTVLENMQAYGFSPVEFSTLKSADAKTDLNTYFIKPKTFDPTKKYPVLMYVYGGPGSQNVIDRWGGSNYVWFQYLAQQGYIVACVDNRGTGAKGEAFKKITYKQLGKYETEDQIAAATYFATLPFVDGKRIGIFGWSYGGYMASLCITKGAEIFNLAIAVAPVINWRYYDSIYTERFMQTPQLNPEGYDTNSPSTHANKLKGNYLIIHGTADDNVHFQNSMVMAKELIKNNKKFDLEVYPDKNHGIYGGKTRLQLFTKMTDYLTKNL